MSDLTPEAKKFLEQHAGTGAPTLKQKARSRAALLTALAAPSAAAAVATVGMSVGTKVLIAVVAVTVGGAVAVPAVHWARTPKAVPVTHSLPPVAAAPHVVPQAVEVETQRPEKADVKAPARAAVHRAGPATATPSEPETPALPPTVVAAPAPSTPASDEQLSAELELLTAAQLSLRASKPEEALKQLDEHQRRFGRSARLTEEVQAARIGALCALGRHDEAQAEHARLSQASVYFSRLGHACW